MCNTPKSECYKCALLELARFGTPFGASLTTTAFMTFMWTMLVDSGGINTALTRCHIISTFKLDHLLSFMTAVTNLLKIAHHLFTQPNMLKMSLTDESEREIDREIIRQNVRITELMLVSCQIFSVMKLCKEREKYNVISLKIKYSSFL